MYKNPKPMIQPAAKKVKHNAEKGSKYGKKHNFGISLIRLFFYIYD